MRCFVAFLMLILAAATASAAEGAKVLDHKLKDIQGNEVSLSDYEGKVVMLVNVASKCGMTPQYEQLVDIHQKYKDQGFVVLGFPANNFMNQEPGTEAEIMEFCTMKYGVEFPMFSKISVKGDDMDPLYAELTSEENGEHGGEIKWNFTKFLVGRDGTVIGRFEPRTRPDAPEVVEAIETALAQ